MLLSYCLSSPVQDRMLGCKSSLPTRTRLWHDPLVEVWLMLARMAGLSSDAPFLRNPLDAKAKRAQLHMLNNQKPRKRSVGTVSEPFPCPSGGRGCNRILPEAEPTGRWRRTQAT